MRSVARPKPAPIDMFFLLGQSVFRLDRTVILRWWVSLEASTHPLATKVYRQFARYRGTAGNFAWFVFHDMAARDLIHATEALADAGSLSRPEATQIQEGILNATRPDGAWK